MAKVDPGTIKYIVHADIEVDGIVEKPDVIGAIFGQTEGLLGDDLDLRELQKMGRIGRIEVELKSEGGKTRGHIMVPSSLGKVETALVAAALEAIDRVGPCTARVKVTGIEDVRESKRKQILERAKEILTTFFTETSPETQELVEQLKSSLRAREIIEYGPEKLPAGPDVPKADSIIIVEGRADVINLLRAGIRNAIAVEGTSIPKTIVDLTKEKIAIAFVDGDRGGKLILKELFQVADIDYVAFAPEGKEVEELTRKEIIKALREKVPASQVKQNLFPELMEEGEKKREIRKSEGILGELGRKFKDIYEELKGTGKAYLLNDKLEKIEEIPVRDLTSRLKESDQKPYAVVLDGIITQRLIDAAIEKEVRYLVGFRRSSDIMRVPLDMRIITIEELGG